MDLMSRMMATDHDGLPSPCIGSLIVHSLLILSRAGTWIPKWSSPFQFINQHNAEEQLAIPLGEMCIWDGDHSNLGTSLTSLGLIQLHSDMHRRAKQSQTWVAQR